MVVVTDEGYRGRNLGTIVCAFMVEYCCHRNLEPIWSCMASNPASASIARKLEFEEECKYFDLVSFCKTGDRA
jgi:RimJ/RimL family protein N-acetyltransferase